MERLGQPLERKLPTRRKLRTKPKIKETKGTLATDFMHQLFEHWKVHGPQAIVDIYETDKKAYLDVILRALPKQIIVEHEIITQLSQMSDADLGVDLGFLNGYTTPMALIEGEGTEEAH
jgi:hypothetical protein